jgi:putative ABC transport system permease protein
MIQTISIPNLLLAFAPVLIVIGILYRWSLSAKTAIYAVSRMLVQLLLVGYVLAFLFQTDQVPVVLAVLAVMLLVASWISLRPLKKKHRAVYLKALASISGGGVLTLIIITQGVLDLDSWYQPRFVIPLAGMIFSSSMNTVSLAAERFQAETAQGAEYLKARRIALRAALIPLTNSLLAVGLVAIPGMMTGQILSGVEPLLAARYQIMVMCMIFGSAGLSGALFLIQLRVKN